MAKTDGRGNPPWTRDETILALDLFFDAGLVLRFPHESPRSINTLHAD
jgi:5-methylcytosine-specific restriction protein A